MKKTKKHFKTTAILLAALMIFGVLTAPPATVSAAGEGTLYIHKLDNTGVAGGSQDPLKTYYQNPNDNLYYAYLAGAKYTVYKIGTFAETNVSGTISTVFTADPKLVMMPGETFGSATVPGDINLAASITAGLTGSAETAATTDTGRLTIDTGLDQDGVYLIVESTLPPGVASGANFIITVPMYNAETEDWETTVNAYPKNPASTGVIAKTVTKVDGTAVTGSDNTFYGNIDSLITYAVTVTVPTDYTVIGAAPYTKFNILDESSPFLELQFTTDPEDGLTIKGSTSGTFTPVTDYTATYSVPGGGANNKLTVVFTAAGLAKITAGEKLTVSYDAEIQAGAASAADAIVNKAWIEFTKGSGGGTIDPPPTDPPTTVKIFSYGVKKMNDATTPAPLAGASFVLAKKNALDAYEYLEFNSTTEEWDVVAEAAAQVFTTTVSAGTAAAIGDEAILQFKNLDPTVTYYLIETAAPANYIKLLNPVEITADADTTDAVYNTYNAAGTYVPDTGYTVKITNVHKDNGGLIGGGGLPTTGGNGFYIYLIVGAVLMGSAVIFYISRNKSKRKLH